MEIDYNDPSTGFISEHIFEFMENHPNLAETFRGLKLETDSYHSLYFSSFEDVFDDENMDKLYGDPDKVECDEAHMKTLLQIYVENKMMRNAGPIGGFSQELRPIFKKIKTDDLEKFKKDISDKRKIKSLSYEEIKNIMMSHASM